MKYSLASCEIVAGTGYIPTATVVVHVPEKGEKRSSSEGKTSILALKGAFDKVTGAHGVSLVSMESAFVEENPMDVEIRLRLQKGKTVFGGKGRSPDWPVAWALAYLDALEEMAAQGISLDEVSMTPV